MKTDARKTAVRRRRGEEWRRKITGSGRRMTRPRGTVLEVLGQTKQHLSAKEVYLRAHKLCPSCGMTTIYRTLELMVEMGVVMKFAFGEGQSRYELAEGHTRKPHHHHLVCRKCGRIEDYSDFLQDELDLVKRSERTLAKRHGFRIQEHEITFKGLCPDCK
ncbi:Fur family transcriptional regulator [Elusimicrobiota bacterium]